MKKKKLLRSFDLAHEKYVDEADPARDAAVRKNAFSKNKIVKWSALVASLLAVVIVANVFLFMPYDNTPPSVDEYANSEYYPIIKKLNQLTYNTYKKPKYKNLFEYIKDSLENIDFEIKEKEKRKIIAKSFDVFPKYLWDFTYQKSHHARGIGGTV